MKMGDKYEILYGDSLTVVDSSGKEYTVYRVRAIKDITPDVKLGALGGYISSEDCLSQEGKCWVFANSVVVLTSVSGNAGIHDSTLFHSFALDNCYIYNSELVHCHVEGNANIRNCALDRVDIYNNSHLINCRLKDKYKNIYSNSVLDGNIFINAGGVDIQKYDGRLSLVRAELVGRGCFTSPKIRGKFNIIDVYDTQSALLLKIMTEDGYIIYDEAKSIMPIYAN